MPYSHTQFIASLRKILEGPPPKGEEAMVIRKPRVIWATPDGRHRLLEFPARARGATEGLSKGSLLGEPGQKV